MSIILDALRRVERERPLPQRAAGLDRRALANRAAETGGFFHHHYAGIMVTGALAAFAGGGGSRRAWRGATP